MVLDTDLAVTVRYEVYKFARLAHGNYGILWEEELGLNEVDDVLYDVHFVAEDWIL